MRGRYKNNIVHFWFDLKIIEKINIKRNFHKIEMPTHSMNFRMNTFQKFQNSLKKL
jgi:hypothetical protein